MRKTIITVIIAAALCASFTGCGGSGTSGTNSAVSNVQSKDCAAKAAELNGAVNFTIGDKVLGEESKKSLEKGQLKDTLGVDPDDVTDFCAYIVASGACPDQFGVFVAKDADAASRVEQSLIKRVEQQRKVFIDDGYTPGEKYKFDDSFVQTNGTTVCYAICADNAKALELLK